MSESDEKLQFGEGGGRKGIRVFRLVNKFEGREKKFSFLIFNTPKFYTDRV